MYVSSFSFFHVNEANIQKEIVNLNGIKTSKNSDIPTKLSNKILAFLLVFYAIVLIVQ